MRITWEPLTLRLRHSFNIAHGAYTERGNILVRIDDDGMYGMGEAAVVPYLGETREGVIAYMERLARLVETEDGPADLVHELPHGAAAARAAMDMALTDLEGKRLRAPFWQILGLDPSRAGVTSVTIGLETAELMAEQARLLNCPILKIKLGGPDDPGAMRAIRAATKATLRVDANAGWTREAAAEIIPALADLGVELVEQPLPADDIEGLRWLRERVPLPLFADESVRSADDVTRLAGCVDGIVVKLAKLGGIRDCVLAIDAAREQGMKVMLSCMIESTLAVTAAAHLAPLCEYIDLDGPLLIASDPFLGIEYDDFRLVLPTGPGLGVAARRQESA